MKKAQLFSALALAPLASFARAQQKSSVAWATSTPRCGRRTTSSLRNQPGFYQAFGVKPGDKMYLAPKDRVIMW